jgi:hypothetical protein
MPTYATYLFHARLKGFQPLSEPTFNSLIEARYNPITNQFIKGSV